MELAAHSITLLPKRSWIYLYATWSLKETKSKWNITEYFTKKYYNKSTHPPHSPWKYYSAIQKDLILFERQINDHKKEGRETNNDQTNAKYENNSTRTKKACNNGTDMSMPSYPHLHPTQYALRFVVFFD